MSFDIIDLLFIYFKKICCFVLLFYIIFMFTNVMASGELFMRFHILLLYLFCSLTINYFSQKKDRC